MESDDGSSAGNFPRGSSSSVRGVAKMRALLVCDEYWFIRVYLSSTYCTVGSWTVESLTTGCGGLCPPSRFRIFFSALLHLFSL